MTVETASNLAQLNSSLPDPNDPKSEGDDHIRLIKATLQAVFPNFNGRFQRTQSKTADYTLTPNDSGTIIEFTAGANLLGDAASAAATLGNGWFCIVYANGVAITFNPNSAEQVNGAATLVIPSGVAALIRCDGAGFTAFYLFLVGGNALAVLGGAPLADPSFTGTLHALLAKIKPFGSTEFDVGYRDLPQNAQNNDYTFVLNDRGLHVYKSDAVAHAWTIPPNSSVAYPVGSAITVVNDGSAGNITLTQGAGVVLVFGGVGTTGNRTLAVGGVATLLKVGTDRWIVNGSGVS